MDISLQRDRRPREKLLDESIVGAHQILEFRALVELDVDRAPEARLEPLSARQRISIAVLSDEQHINVASRVLVASSNGPKNQSNVDGQVRKGIPDLIGDAVSLAREPAKLIVQRTIRISSKLVHRAARLAQQNSSGNQPLKFTLDRRRGHAGKSRQLAQVERAPGASEQDSQDLLASLRE